MLYRRFGRTELEMPVSSCGGVRYHYKWQDVPLSEVPSDNQANLEATIRRSVELGIHPIETARGYGSSERQLGLVLPSFPRKSLIVQTKIAPTANADEFVQHFRESLERLQLQHIDLLALHGINTYETLWHSVRPNGCLAAARRLQREGAARHIGFSTHMGRLCQDALQPARQRRPRVSRPQRGPSRWARPGQCAGRFPLCPADTGLAARNA